MRDELDDPLSALFAEYRSAVPDPEPSAMFTPGMWQKIEARQTGVVGFRRFARALITAAAAASLLMGAWLAVPRQQPAAAYSQTYLELLAASAENHDVLDEADLVRPDERSR